MIPHEFDSVDEFKEAFDIANQVSWNQQELDIYEHIAFEEHAERYEMEAEYSKGIKQGIEQGVGQGIELTAINMLKQNVEVAFVVQCTGLTLERVEQLKESL